jgi:hypothetical protein
MNTKIIVTQALSKAACPRSAQQQPVQPGDAGPDSTLEVLQAVVMTQKAQIDALRASLEGLLAVLNSPASSLGTGWAQPLMAQAQTPPAECCPAGTSEPVRPDAGLLGNPSDPQFASMHQLMERLRRG